MREFLAHPAVVAACSTLRTSSGSLHSLAVTVVCAAFPEMPSRLRKELWTVPPPIRTPVASEADFGFSAADREATAILLAAFAQLPPERVTGHIVAEAVRFLRHVHGPGFNNDPQGTLGAIDEQRATAPPALRVVLDALHQHYDETLQLQRLLEGYGGQE